MVSWIYLFQGLIKIGYRLNILIAKEKMITGGGEFSLYHPCQLGLKLNKDLYIKYSASADSNENYLAEIWRISFSVKTKWNTTSSHD